MKKIAAIILAAALGICQANAQDLLEVRRVGLDSLISFIRKEVNPRTYYTKQDEDQSTFTVSAPADKFLEKATEALREKGYLVSEYRGCLLIAHSRTFRQSLPTGWFASSETVSDDSELQKFLAEQNAIVTFQNKIYEIGDENSGRSGKVYLSGHVRDVSSGEPLVGVSVYNEDAGIYDVTDASGFYRIMVPTGDQTLKLSGYSLEDMKLSLKVWSDGVLDVVMKEKVTALTGAVISADDVSHHRNASIGIEKVRMDVVQKVPTAFGEADIIKVVLTLPGVKSVGEASSGFNVRGGSTDQNLILFNGGTIFNPSHLFGLFSAFNPDVVSEIELYKSSIPAEFGGRISSVLDVHSKEGNSKKVTGSVGLGLLTSRLHVEGPIKKDKTTFVLGGRTTYSNWIFNLLPEDSNYAGGNASFSDVNAAITHKINDKNTIQAFGYWSRDQFAFSRDTTFRYGNIDASLRWRSNFNEKNSMTFSAGYDKYDAGFDNDFNPYSSYRINTGIQEIWGKLAFTSTIAQNHKLSYGLNATMHVLNPGEMLPLHPEESLIKEKHLTTERGLEPAIYAGDSWTVNDDLMIDGGLRLSGFMVPGTSKFYGAPEFRISGKYTLGDNTSVKAGFNNLNQYIHLITNTSSISPIDTWKLSDADVKPQTGWQAAAGLYHTVGNGVAELTLEAYYKRSRNQLDYKSGATLLMNDHLASDLVPTYGKAYGVEFMAKKTNGKLTGWVSYTYSRAFLKEMQDRGPETINRGEWYNAPHDKPHDVKVVGNYKFTHRYSLSFNLDYSTGRPVTLPVGKYRYGGGLRMAYSDRNACRIPDYFRLDLALNIDPGHYLKQLTHMSVTLGVYNLTGHHNAYSVYYTSNGMGINGNMLSIFACPIPYVNLNLNF